MKNQKNVKVYELEFYGTKYNVVLAKGSYIVNDTLAVLMYISTPKGKIKEDFGDLTQNIGESTLLADDTRQFIDTNNLGNDIVKWLVKNKIAKKTDIVGFSGYCQYPMVEFTKEALDGMLVLE